MLVQMSKEALIPSPAVYGSSRLTADLDDIHVESLATSIARHEHHIRRHRHVDLFQFFVIQSGHADCQMDAQRLALDGPGLLVVPALAVHQFVFTPGTSGQVVSISHALLREFERVTGGQDWLGGLGTARWIPLDRSHAVFSSGDALWHRFNEPTQRRLHLTACAMTLVSSIVSACDQHREARAVVPGGQQQLVDAFIQDIEEHYASNDTIPDYCRRLKVTERTLRRATTARLQLSPIALVHQRKCLEAQRLLRFTALSISEVAYALGFSDPSYFSRRFKQLTGVVPRGLRPQ